MERVLVSLALATSLLLCAVAAHAQSASDSAPTADTAPAPAQVAPAAEAASATVAFPSDAQIRQILRQRIEVDQRGVGMVVGLLDADGTRVVAYGETERGNGQLPDGDTIFEIGSISKAFTGTLLASLVASGDVRLDQPVADLLPDGVEVPERGGVITLQSLATHSSGLPRLPDNIQPADVTNPYADYSVDQLYAFLKSHQLRRDVGAEVEYSNLAFGLLGHALALKAGRSWEDLVRRRITGPLGMNDTVISLTPAQRSRFASPHRMDLTPTPAWDIPTLAGAGALRSTAHDMLRLGTALLGLDETSETRAKVREALREARQPRVDMGVPGMEVGLGWMVRTGDSSTIVWHNGGTGGSRSFFGVDAATGRAVVVLANTEHGADDIGFHLLDPSNQLAIFAPPPQEIEVEATQLQRYVGRYQLAPSFLVEITREDDQLFAQATGQPRFPIFASGPHEFFFKIVEARLIFEVDGEGPATKVTLHQGGQVVPGPRVEEAPN